MKVRYTRCSVSLLAVVATLAASGCGTESQLTNNGETIVFHSQQEPDSLNPMVSDMMASIDAASPIFEGLTQVDDKLETVPVLAETVPSVENGLVKVVGKGLIVTWPLRKNVKWHDGQPFTAEDVKFTFDAVMHKNTKVSTRQGFDKISKFEVVDPHTVRLTFSEVYAPYDLLMTINGSPILPKHLLADLIKDPNGDSVNKTDFNRHPIGTGPFKFKAWVSGDHISYEAFNDYWRGKPKAKALKMRIVPDENSAFTLLKSGELDIYQSASIGQYEALKKLKHVEPSTQPSLTWEHLDFNLDKPALKDVKVRRAIAHAINKKQISEKIYQGLWAVAHSDIAPMSWAYNKSVENRYPYDPEKAKAMLEEAGWKVGVDGIRVKDGHRLSLKIATTAGRKNRELTELVLKYYLKKVGVELNIDNQPGPIFFGNYPEGTLKGGKFDLGMAAWVAGPDPDNLSLWHSSQVPPAQGQNHVRFRNKEMDQLLESGTKTVERSERLKIYHRTAEILADELPIIPMLYWTNLNPYNKRLKGFKPNPSNAGNLWNVYEWQVETDPAMIKASTK